MRLMPMLAIAAYGLIAMSLGAAYVNSRSQPDQDPTRCTRMSVFRKTPPTDFKTGVVAQIFVTYVMAPSDKNMQATARIDRIYSGNDDAKNLKVGQEVEVEVLSRCVSQDEFHPGASGTIAGWVLNMDGHWRILAHAERR